MLSVNTWANTWMVLLLLFLFFGTMDRKPSLSLFVFCIFMIDTSTLTEVESSLYNTIHLLSIKAIFSFFFVVQD